MSENIENIESVQNVEAVPHPRSDEGDTKDKAAEDENVETALALPVVHYEVINENEAVDSEYPGNSNSPERGQYPQFGPTFSAGGAPVYIQTGPGNASRFPMLRPGGGEDPWYPQQLIFDESFSNRVVRHRFIQRVYTILAVQLTITFSFIALCQFEENTRIFLAENPIFLWVAMGLVFVVLCCYCSTTMRRKWPYNFILLLIFTLAFAVVTGVFTCLYSTKIVLGSVGITAVIVIAVSIFACQTSIDITDWGLILCCALYVLTAFGFAALIVFYITQSSTMWLIYSALAAILFALYLMYDTQQIIGGRRIEMSPEEYVYAALTLYIDIMYIFIHIMHLLGGMRR